MQMLLRTSLTTLALIGGVWVAGPVQAAAIDIGTLPGGATCETTGINSAHTVIGQCISSHLSQGRTVAVFQKSGDAIPSRLPALVAGKPCNVAAIGDDGTVSGQCEDAAGTRQPVRWTVDGSGSYTALPTALLPYQRPNYDVIVAEGGWGADVNALAGPVNSAGVIVGISESHNGTRHAVLWNPGATAPVRLRKPQLAAGQGAVQSCEPLAINDAVSLTVVGHCKVTTAGATTDIAVSWTAQDGKYFATVLDDLRAGHCIARDVNIVGDVVGACETISGNSNAVLWAANGVLPTVVLRATQSVAVKINNAGVITGSYLTADSYAHAFVGNPRVAPVTDIGTLAGGHNCVAQGLDDNGDVAADCDTATSPRIASFRAASGAGVVASPVSAVASAVRGMSHNGAIAGVFTAADGHARGFRDESPSATATAQAVTTNSASVAQVSLASMAATGFAAGVVEGAGLLYADPYASISQSYKQNPSGLAFFGSAYAAGNPSPVSSEVYTF
ncbi:hypothetical protein [Dyella tabacisoli]|uniref:Uncharacterized protein n=1 Tax=Dyella tabacisoli TaxID=2282381 RepID=A0A369URF6_9GAMM|nr:hypothetical protein [Dyella tabacisoli]RDD82883.1 hypothetical protein DVJ77_05045 [Dyella tabacisoli]